MALMPRLQETVEPTLGTLFAQALAGAADTVALTDGDDALTYRQLRDRVGQFLSAFDDEGLKPGEGIGLALRGMTIEFAVAYIACQIAGLWTTELPPHLPIDVVIERVDATGTRLVIVDDTTDAERQEKLAAAMPGKLRYVTELTAQAAPSEVIPRPPGEFCAIVFTSGSTGRPKPVLIPSHGAGTHALMVMATLQYPVSPVAVVPVTNLLILQLLFVPTLLLGGTVVTVAPYSTDGIINAATRHRASVVFLTTSEIYDLTERDDTAGLSSHITLMFYGGEPMSAARLSSVTRAFGQVFVGAYGQTETLTAAFLRPEDHDPARPELLSAAGRALIGARIEVRGDAGTVPPGEPGEIAIASPGCMVGYLGMQDATAKTLHAGWVRTGGHRLPGRPRLRPCPGPGEVRVQVRRSSRLSQCGGPSAHSPSRRGPGGRRRRARPPSRTANLCRRDRPGRLARSAGGTDLELRRKFGPSSRRGPDRGHVARDGRLQGRSGTGTAAVRLVARHPTVPLTVSPPRC